MSPPIYPPTHHPVIRPFTPPPPAEAEQGSMPDTISNQHGDTQEDISGCGKLKRGKALSDIEARTELKLWPQRPVTQDISQPVTDVSTRKKLERTSIEETLLCKSPSQLVSSPCARARVLSCQRLIHRVTESAEGFLYKVLLTKTFCKDER